MPQLLSISAPDADCPEGYPFDLPIVRTLDTVRFEAPVTFLVGENGSGKSTLIEAIAIKAELPIVGGQSPATDPSLAEVRRLAKWLKFAWSRRTHRGFFFRAEDFFRFAQRMRNEIEELEGLKEEYAERFKDRPYARMQATGMAAGQAAAIQARYGRDMHARSHGESFLQFFQARFVPEGLYLMDEPEASLSPQRQLSLLHLMGEMVDRGAQFIVATHSPILMAFQGAAHLSLDDPPIQPVDYDEIEHVGLTRAFLSDPERFLRRL